MPVPEKIEAVQRPLMRDEVYDTLRRWIVEGVLRPDEKLRDIELAERLGVSRMPVREALRRLQDEGLVETAANRWTRVSNIDPEDAKRIYPILWSLEPLAIQLAAGRLGPEELQRMNEANERMKKAIKRSDPVTASEADAEFHNVPLEASGNAELVKIVKDLKVKLHRLEVEYFGGTVTAARSVTEHEELLQALYRTDFVGAAEAVRRNWQRSLARILSL